MHARVITSLMKRPENNFQNIMGRWKFHFRSSQHLSNKDIKQTINLWKMVIGEPKRN